MARGRALGLVALLSTGCATLLVSTDDLNGGPRADGPEAGAPEAAAPEVEAGGSTEAGSPSLDGSIASDAMVGTDVGVDARVFPEGTVVWAGNGHGYLVVQRDGGYSWTAAEQQSRERGGHLVTISSAEENQFVFDLLGDLGPGAWLGGHQPDNTVEPAAGWVWSNGEPMVYTNWAAGQPNDLGGNEDGLHFISDRTMMWSDEDLSETYTAFVVEFD